MNAFRIVAVGLFLGLFALLASCDTSKAPPPDDGSNPPPAYGANCPKVAPTPISVAAAVATPAERAACAAAGGSIERQGLLGAEGCVQPFCDAGQACTDSSECIGRCYADTNTDFDGGPAVGACQPTTSPFGCRTEVVAGAVGPTLCID